MHSAITAGPVLIAQLVSVMSHRRYHHVTMIYLPTKIIAFKGKAATIKKSQLRVAFGH